MQRSERPFKVLKRVNNNTYEIDLPGDNNISTMFNVSYLSPYMDDEFLANLWTNLL